MGRITFLLLRTAIKSLLLAFLASQSLAADSWKCQGMLSSTLELNINAKKNSLVLELIDSNDTMRRWQIKKLFVDRKSGRNETQIHLQQGNPMRGGVRLRLVQHNKDFPKKSGQGNITFRHLKKMRNDVIHCPDVDSIANFIRKNK